MNGFVFYDSFFDALQNVPQKYRLECYETIVKFALFGTEPSEKSTNKFQKIIFAQAKPQIVANLKRRENGKKGAEYGVMGGRPKNENPIGVNNETPKVKVKEESKSKSINIKEESKNESIINNPLPPTRGEAFKADFSFIDGLEDWKELLQIWLDYKKAKKQTYKSQKSIEALFAQLHKLSNGDIETAKKIVEQSMANNWQGLFELKTQNTQNTRTNGTRGFTHAEAAYIVEQSKKIRL